MTPYFNLLGQYDSLASVLQNNYKNIARVNDQVSFHCMVTVINDDRLFQLLKDLFAKKYAAYLDVSVDCLRFTLSSLVRNTENSPAIAKAIIRVIDLMMDQFEFQNMLIALTNDDNVAFNTCVESALEKVASQFSSLEPNMQALAKKVQSDFDKYKESSMLDNLSELGDLKDPYDFDVLFGPR